MEPFGAFDRETRDRLPGTGHSTLPSDQDPPGDETDKPMPDCINAATVTWGWESLHAAEARRARRGKPRPVPVWPNQVIDPGNGEGAKGVLEWYRDKTDHSRGCSGQRGIWGGASRCNGHHLLSGRSKKQSRTRRPAQLTLKCRFRCFFSSERGLLSVNQNCRLKYHDLAALSKEIRKMPRVGWLRSVRLHCAGAKTAFSAGSIRRGR